MPCPWTPAGEDGYLFLAPGTDPKILEHEGARRVGMPVRRQQGLPFSGRGSTPVLLYPNQATFHPLKYLAGLAAAIRRSGGQFFAETTVQTVEEDESGVQVATMDGHFVRAKYAVVATNSPINDRFAIHSKQALASVNDGRVVARQSSGRASSTLVAASFTYRGHTNEPRTEV
jgi:glycine/D-amino acid oxidase-like deaminating enzyme